MSETLSKAAFSALRWNYGGGLARSAANLLVGVLLARLLGPKAFGELAIAGLVVGVANLLADAGFTSALVQAPTLTEVQIRYVFTVQFLIAIAMSAICAATAGLVAVAFYDPAIKPILWAIAPTFVIQALGQTSNGILRRELAFDSLQKAQITSYLCYVVVGVPLALTGAGVWSLVVAQLAQSLIYSAQLYYRVRHSVVPSLDASGTELLRYGSKVTVANMTNWGISNLDNAIVGRTFGAVSLGLYTRAFNLGSSPAESVVSTLQQVLFAACSRTDRRLEAIRRAYLASLSVVALLVFPTFWGMAACAQTVVVGLYGEKWRSSAALFQPLAIAMSMHVLMALSGPILNAANQVRREIVAQVWSLALALVVFLITARISLHAFAWGVCAVYVFRFVVTTLPTLQYLELKWVTILEVLRGPAIAASVTAVILLGVDTLSTNVGVRPFPGLSILLLVGCCVFAVQMLRWADLLLAPQAVRFLQTGLSGMPPVAARFLARCAKRQEATMAAKNGVSETCEAEERLALARQDRGQVQEEEGVADTATVMLPVERRPQPL